MARTQMALQQANTTAEYLYVSFELSGSEWKLTFSNGIDEKLREWDVPAGDLAAVTAAFALAKEKFRLDPRAPVRSVFEAGRDGFWLHRWLLKQGVESLVLDPSSEMVDRQAKRKKTDRIDGKKMVRDLVRWHRGDRFVFRAVRVPTEAQEDARRDSRERERLLKEEKRHRSCIESLLALHGARVEKAEAVDFAKVRTADAQQLPPRLRQELERIQARLLLVRQQRHELEAEERKHLREVKKQLEEREKSGTPAKPPATWEEKALMLMGLKAIGITSAVMLTQEYLFRSFENGRQVGSGAGMTGSPFASGGIDRELGISKAGNRRVRSMMVELSWLWLRYQPNSGLSKWFHARFGGGKRTRRVGIVALGRRLLVALWRYVERGVVPEGVQFKDTVKF